MASSTDEAAIILINNNNTLPRVTHSSHSDLRFSASDGDQLIPTAIVIKNIPFAVRKETLTSITLEMQLPQPYAFNY